MTEIRCNNCNELNDRNSVKCEACKASLVTVTPIESCPDEEDECERDFRFIEEAEFIGRVYKLENFDDLDVHINGQRLKTEKGFNESTICCQIPDSSVENIVKLEDDDDTDKASSKSAAKNSSTQNKQVDRTSVVEKTTSPTRDQYKCKHCPKTFKRKASMRAHINRMHNPEDSSVCCGRHHASHHAEKSKTKYLESYESEYQCSDDEPTESMPSLHPTTRFNNNPLGKLKGKFKLESADCQNNNSHKKPPLKKFKSEQVPQENKSNGIVYKCAACEKITDSYQDHLKHIVIHEKIDKSLTVKTSLEQLKQTPSGFLKCKECGGVFMSEREYNIHQRSHQGVHQCDICKTILLTPSSLRKHKLRMHRQTPTRKTTLFECNICNEKYESQLLMLQHRKQHTEVMKKIEEMTIIDRSGQKVAYVCKICAKTSNNKFRHEEHLRTHTGEKPYKCEKCGVAIATSNAMAHHMRTHENVTFDCNVCDATYRHKKSLKKHLKLHTGERPFGCRHCDKTFAFNYTRADHERKCHIDGGTSRIQNRKRKVNSGKKSSLATDAEGDAENENVNRDESQSQSEPAARQLAMESSKASAEKIGKV